MVDISARNLAKYGLRKGAYNGSQGRRFVYFERGTDDATGEPVEWRNEFSTKRERDTAVADALRRKLTAPAEGVLEALGALLDAYGEVDAMLDAYAAADPEGMTRDEKRRQRESNRVRDRASRVYARAKSGNP